MSQGIKIRLFQRNDSERVIQLISDIIINEFKFKLEFDTLDADILGIGQIYNPMPIYTMNQIQYCFEFVYFYYHHCYQYFSFANSLSFQD